jgi:hypothetical protein
MCEVQLPLGVNPTAANKYINNKALTNTNYTDSDLA